MILASAILPQELVILKQRRNVKRHAMKQALVVARMTVFFYNRSFCVGFDSPPNEVPQYQQTAKWHINLWSLMTTICFSKITYDPAICEKTYLIGNYNTKEECEQDRIRLFSAKQDYYKYVYCTNEASNPQNEELYKKLIQDALAREHYQQKLDQFSKSKQENPNRDDTYFYSKLEAKLLSEKNRKEYISTLKQLANAAEYSLRALKFALDGDLEMARVLSSCQFDNSCPYKPEQTIVISVPSPITPVLESSQAKIYNYIKDRANKYLAEITENQQKMQEIMNDLNKIELKRSEIKEKKARLEEQIKETNLGKQKEELTNKKTELEREDSSLLIQAQNLLKTAEEMKRRAEEIKQELNKLDDLFNQVSKDPNKADEMYRKITGKS